MEYRKLGRTGLVVSAIGMGTEYLINRPREQVIPVIREGIARGISFFDLFFAQSQFRDNMGAAFQGHRERVFLGAHLGAVEQNGQEDRTRDPREAETFFHDFLRRYYTDHADVLFMHNIDEQEDYDRAMNPEGLLGLALRLKREGKARFIGFSGHTVATSLQAVESGQVEVLMFPINLTGQATPGKKELFSACAERGVGLVAMKPYAGGKLLAKERKLAVENWQTGGGDLQLERSVSVTPVQCLAYVLAQTGLSTTIPGVKDLTELDAALAYWQASDGERDYSAILSDFRQYVMGECVYCNHCLPCPSAIDIGQTIRLFEAAERRMTEEVAGAYAALPTHADDCTQCGSCVERCPFGVDAMGKMEQAAALFS